MIKIRYNHLSAAGIGALDALKVKHIWIDTLGNDGDQSQLATMQKLCAHSSASICQKYFNITERLTEGYADCQRTKKNAVHVGWMD